MLLPPILDQILELEPTLKSIAPYQALQAGYRPIFDWFTCCMIAVKPKHCAKRATGLSAVS